MLILMLNYIAKKYHSFALKTIPKSSHNIILGLISKYQLTFPSALKLMCSLQLLQLGFTALFLYYFFQWVSKINFSFNALAIFAAQISSSITH